MSSIVTIEQVKQYNKTNVNWNKFFSVVETVGSSMNGQKDRFDKSDIIEMALSEFSSGNIEYVNDDGVDHKLVNLKDENNNETTQEMKFLTGSFYDIRVIQRAKKATKKSPAREQIKGVVSLPGNKTINIKLMNSNGENSHKALPKDYAKFLLVVDNYSAHVVEVSKLSKFLKFTGDGIEAKSVPREIFTQIISPDEVTNRVVMNMNYKQEKLKFQKNFLSQF